MSSRALILIGVAASVVCATFIPNITTPSEKSKRAEGSNPVAEPSASVAVAAAVAAAAAVAVAAAVAASATPGRVREARSLPRRSYRAP